MGNKQSVLLVLVDRMGERSRMYTENVSGSQRDGKCDLISHFNPKTHFEFYTLMRRGYSQLSSDISIVFVLEILSKIHHITY